MTRILFLFCSILFFGLVSQNAYAASAGMASGAESETVLEVDLEQLDNLIETLESEEERQSFIGNLKALKDVGAQQAGEAEKSPKTLVALLGLDVPAEWIQSGYRNFLNEYNLDNSSFANWVTTGVIFIIVLILLFFNNKICLNFLRKINAIKDRFGLTHERTQLYARALRYIGYLLILMSAAWFLAIAWNIDTQDSFIMNAINFSRIFSLSVLILAAIIIWELIDGFMQYSMQSANRMAKARLKTLLPIARNVILITFITLFSMMFLSELGVDVMPLLAGAGVIGIAIGFGAQTMVKDFISGFIIVLEDLIQVGDVVKVSGMSGVVERITIRKIQLRALNGSVFTIPFGDITTIENMTKDFSFYALDIGVAYRENTDEVIKYLREVDEDLRADEAYKDFILEPLEILGVDQFADSAVVIKARIKTKPIKQWFVGREFNRRMKYKFDEMGVEIPFPHQTIYFGEDKDGTAPPAPIIMQSPKKSLAKAKSSTKSATRAKSKAKPKKTAGKKS